MDVTATFKLMEHLSQPANYTDPRDRPTTAERLPVFTDGPAVLRNVLSWTIGIAIGLFAAYLSWQCNTRMDYGAAWKVINAFFAYLFGLVYILLYVVFRWDVCRKII